MNKRPMHSARIAAAEIDDGSWGGRGRDRALVQLARDWRAWPSRREHMVQCAPPTACTSPGISSTCGVLYGDPTAWRSPHHPNRDHGIEF